MQTRRGSIPTRREGFTLVDVCVALFILAIALGTLIGSVFSAMRLGEVDEETASASQIMRGVLEQMNAVPFAEVYTDYNKDPQDNPDPLHDYCADLVVADPLFTLGGKAGPVVEVVFPGDDNNELREDAVDAGLGLPRDLNGDGVIDASNHANDYALLPVTIRLQWEGAAGTRTLAMSTLLRNR